METRTRFQRLLWWFHKKFYTKTYWEWFHAEERKRIEERIYQDLHSQRDSYASLFKGMIEEQKNQGVLNDLYR